eukprot:1138139-Pelagomonas_calceolata.AAC.2
MAGWLRPALGSATYTWWPSRDGILESAIGVIAEAAVVAGWLDRGLRCQVLLKAEEKRPDPAMAAVTDVEVDRGGRPCEQERKTKNYVGRGISLFIDYGKGDTGPGSKQDNVHARHLMEVVDWMAHPLSQAMEVNPVLTCWTLRWAGAKIQLAKESRTGYKGS